MIATDFDDVIIDLDTFLRAELERRTGHSFPDRSKYYVDIPGMTSDEVGQLVGQILEEKTEIMNPIKGTIEALEKIHKLIQKEILIVTARESKLEKVTKNWLSKHVGNKFPYTIKFTNRKSKIDFFNKDTRFFIDDHPFFANDSSKVLEHVFLLDKPWNQNIYLRKNVSRIKTVETVYVVLQKLLNMERSGKS